MPFVFKKAFFSLPAPTIGHFMSNLSTASNNLYDLYVQACKDLAQSIVIKLDSLAQGVNNAVLLKTGEVADPNNPASWKYYQNICGVYHSSDTLMRVYSLDSENTIDFTLEAMVANPVTKAAYTFNSSYYNDLLAAYPDQEMLILGILYPTDLNTALNAADGTILSYPTELVETSETDFIALLQAWVFAYVHRWYNSAYTLTDDLYTATFLAQLTVHVFGIITNIRLAACKTNQAHSFHINQYLRSHGFLDTYLRQMTRKQALDMYRNINYYERNAGFEATFERLVEVILSEAGLPAYSYRMLHNEESMQHASAVDTQHLLPVAHFERKPINLRAKQFPLPTLTLTQVQSYQADETPYNDAYQIANHDQVQQSLSRARYGRLPTKVVECAINPIGNPSNLPPQAVLFNHWIDWAASDRYAVPVEFVTEGETEPIRLNHQEAVAMWIYVTIRALEPEQASYPHLLRVPPMAIQKVVRTPIPDITDISSITDSVIPTALMQQLYSTAVAIPNQVSSLVQFEQLCGQIYAASLQQYRLYSFQQDPTKRSYLQAAATRLYADKIVKLTRLQDPASPGQGMLYTTLIQQLGLNFAGYRPVDYFNTAVRIMSSATGADLTALLDPTNVQKAMVNLLRYLCSYSIQIVVSGLSDLRVTVASPDIRASQYTTTEAETALVDIGPSIVMDSSLADSFSFDYQLEKIPSSNFESLRPTISFTVLLDKIRNDSYAASALVQAKFNAGTDIGNTFDPDALWAALTPTQREAVVDVYS